VLADELYHFLERIDLGIQPSASPSHRRGAEVKQRHLAGRLGLLQALIGIAQPLNFRHLVYLPSRMKSQPALFDSGDLGQGSGCSIDRINTCVGGLVKDTLREWQI